MQLDPHDLHLFFKLYPALLCFVNQRLNVVEKPLARPEKVIKLPTEERIKLRDALVANMNLIDAFASENPFRLSEDEQEIVRSWNDLVAGEFYVYRCLTNYTVFLTTREPVVAYGVLSLIDSFEDLIGFRLPHLCKATLLPFKGRIVYDGLLAGSNITFGSGIRRRLKESYEAAKERQGIVTTLPPPVEMPQQAKPKPAAKKRATGTKTKSGMTTTSEVARRAHDEIVGLTDAFCREFLDDEYATLCRRLAGVPAGATFPSSSFISAWNSGFRAVAVYVVGSRGFAARSLASFSRRATIASLWSFQYDPPPWRSPSASFFGKSARLDSSSNSLFVRNPDSAMVPGIAVSRRRRAGRTFGRRGSSPRCRHGPES